MESKYNVNHWLEENKSSFEPPVCNKLMHKKQLSVMFVGGPNRRTDFHLEEGSEFFYQMKGNMELPTIQRGERKLVKIGEGQVFLLKSRIPHSPQRPEAGSLGLVIERSRSPDEFDGLRFYTDFGKCDQILWEKYFYCDDLGKDLVPVVQAYMASDESKTMVPSETSVAKDPPLKQDTETVLPEPFDLWPWIEAHKAELDAGKALNLFPNHPCREITVLIVGGGSTHTGVFEYETWVYQMRGPATVEIDGLSHTLEEDECCIIRPNTTYTITRPPGAIGMVVTQHPLGNKPASAAKGDK